MGRSTQIMEVSFRRGLNSEVVTFSTRLAVQPSPLYKSNGEKSKMAASYFCILPSDWPKWIYSSIQVQLYVQNASQSLEVCEIMIFQQYNLRAASILLS